MLAQAVEHLIKNIVDFPDDVSVKSHENARGELIRVRVNPEDIGRVIGRSGRTANAIRTVVQALSDHKVRVEFVGFLRPQVKFDGPDQLVDELKRNVEEIKCLTA